MGIQIIRAIEYIPLDGYTNNIINSIYSVRWVPFFLIKILFLFILQLCYKKKNKQYPMFRITLGACSHMQHISFTKTHPNMSLTLFSLGWVVHITNQTRRPKADYYRGSGGRISSVSRSFNFVLGLRTGLRM